MNALIQVATNEQGSQVVSARELHAFLESKQQFADWIKNRIEKYGLVENQDYTTFSEIYEKGRPRINYALMLDTAKELAMVEANEKGQQARRYFIECEKQLKSSPALSQLDILAQSVQILQQQQREIAEVKAVQAEQGESIRMLEARTQTRPDYFTIVGYASLNRISVGIKTAASAGQIATRICKQRGIQTESCPDPRFGTVNMYPSQVLKEVFAMPIV